MVQKYKILVVDDEPEIASIIRLRLENAGYDVVTAVHGLDGLDKLKQHIPDMIITDVIMPEMDGFAFYKQLKNSPAWAQVPVLVLTSRGKMEDAFRVVGVDAFLTKPFDHHELLVKVQKLLKGASSPALEGHARKILVAGSADEVLAQMAVLLKKQGHDVQVVSTGPDVISRAVVFLPELIIMEAQMYGMASPEIINVLRQMPQFQKLRILAYSYYKLDDLGSEDVRQKALGVDADQAACVENGADAYIGRFNENTFLKTVSRYLQT